MALSRLLGKGQTPIICQFCEIETKISNKCLDCNLLMCENCSVKLHPKVKGAGDHIIVNIKSLGSQHSVDFKDFSSIKCEEHQKQLACLFCNTCKQAVCPGCVSKVHKQHNIEEFQNLYRQKVERLQCGIGKVDTDCKELERRIQHLDNIKTMETTRLSNMRQNILDQATLIKTEIDEYLRRLTTEIDGENTEFDTTIKREQSKMNNIKQKLIEHRQRAQEMKESSNMAEFFANVTDVTQTMEECLPPPCSITSGKLQLLPESKFHPNIVGALLHDITNPEFKSNIEISKTYVSEESVVQFLTAGPDNSLWYSCNIDQKVLKRAKPGEKTFEIVSRVNLMVYGIVCIPGYGLLLSTDGETLKIIPEDSNEILDSRFSVDPLEPKCLHLTKDYKLAIGAVSKGPLYQTSGQRVVILMDMEGNKLSTFEFNKKGKRLLTHPWGIASTSNGNVFILDRTSSNCAGRLVVLNRDAGRVIDIYDGRKGKNFVPRGIVATKADKIIITDCDDPEISLHILNYSGKLISYYNTRDIGIELPFSMAYSANGHFYIGGTTCRDTEKAQLFEIDLNET